MRIAWFTPFSVRSAIGEFSRHVTTALAEHADVELWTADAPPWQPSQLRVVAFAGDDPLGDALRDRDVLIHNIGNHPGYHAAIHAVSQRHPGIVILHDRVLHHLFASVWQRDAATFDSMYVARMSARYGGAGAARARETLSGARRPVWEGGDELERYPLDEEALARARGVVTHSSSHAARLREAWFGPVTELALPSYRTAVERGGAVAPERPARPDGRLQVTTFGHIVPNKSVDRVIATLAADAELAARVHYSIAGAADAGYAAELERLLRANPHVSAELVGWRPEPELDELLAATDVFVNLRHPVTESGSSSLARQLAFGSPVLCFDSGTFSELPPGTVARVPAPDFSAAGAELARLICDPARRRAIGAAARREALARSEQRYAIGLLEFIEEVRVAAPSLALLDRVGAELGAMRADPRLAVYETLARELAPLIAPRGRSRRRHDDPAHGAA